MMQIKCPKCRFKFDTPVAPGITEILCVCPRCGTPFTYVISLDERENIDAKPAEAKEEECAAVSLSEKDKTTSPHSSQNTNSSFTPFKENLDWQKGSKPKTKPVTKDNVYKKRKRKRIKSYREFILLVFFLCFILIAKKSCRSYSSKNNMTGAPTEKIQLTDSDDSKSSSAASSSDVDPFEEIHPGKAPSWIQGTWVFHADYGDIKLTINGDSICELIDNDMVKGTFYYKNHQLVCDFGSPDNIMIYRLDVNRQQIDAGNGMMMKKE